MQVTLAFLTLKRTLEPDNLDQGYSFDLVGFPDWGKNHVSWPNKYLSVCTKYTGYAINDDPPLITIMNGMGLRLKSHFCIHDMKNDPAMQHNFIHPQD